MDPQMDTQTLVANEIASEEITNQAKVSEFKTALADIRLRRANNIQILLKLNEEIKARNLEIGNLKYMFMDQALSMYPELAARNVDEVIASISPVHPLATLWQNFSVKIDGQAIQLNKSAQKWDEGMLLDAQLKEKEKENLANYQKFYEMSSTPIPTPGELEAELQLLSQIPYSEEGSVVASLPAIETLSPDAADMVMMQALSSDTAGKLQSIDQVYEGEEFYNGEIQASYLPAINPSQNQTSDGILSGHGIKKAGLLLGVAAFIYIFVLGSDKNEK